VKIDPGVKIQTREYNVELDPRAFVKKFQFFLNIFFIIYRLNKYKTNPRISLQNPGALVRSKHGGPPELNGGMVANWKGRP